MVRLLLYVSIFLAAFLLFFIQPVLAKYLLPYTGGTAAVWTISIIFYSASLVLGYLYASVLTNLPSLIARFVHTTLLVITGALLLSRVLSEGQFVPETVLTTQLQSWSVLLVLLFVVGLPAVLLASTSILVQTLFARYTKEDPYWLYALSNAGSLSGLLLFPFLLEPFINLSALLIIWTSLFLLFVLLLSTVWRQVEFGTVQVERQSQVDFTSLTHPWSILLFASVPTLLLASLTELLSRGIASFPLLWIIPLVIYLISIIIAFRGTTVTHQGMISFITVIALIPTLIVLPQINTHTVVFWFGFLICMFSYFLISVYFHTKVYALRPKVRGLSTFYIWFTIGGVVGSGVVGLLLPVITNQAIEAFVALAAVAVYMLLVDLKWAKQELDARLIQLVRIATSGLVLVFLYTSLSTTGVVASERNFYGTVSIVDATRSVFGESVEARYMVHGVITHGLEALDERFKAFAVSYYGPGSGIELALRYFFEDGTEPSVNVIGLGAGMMNVYCDQLSQLDYIEINPIIVTLAEKHFSYLSTCVDKTEVFIGDGRLVLEQVKPGPYDVIMIDAFSDDAIPAHLLTSEAFVDTYVPNLTSTGIVAIHITNKYLNLLPPIAGMVAGTNYKVIAVTDVADPENSFAMTTAWVLLAPPEVASKLLEYENTTLYAGRSIKWTDERSSIVSVLSLQGSRTNFPQE